MKANEKSQELEDDFPEPPPRAQRSEIHNLSVIETKDNYNLRAAMIHVIGDVI